MQPLRTVTIVGVGLIGGSIGLALRQHGLAERIVGIGRRKSSLDKALGVGAITQATTDFAEGCRNADLVVVCSPVGLIADHVRRCAEHCPAGTLLTDGGSTKLALVRELDGPLPNDCRFLGGHPLAGSEKTGPENAFAGLYEDRLWILTPTQNSQPQDVTVLESLWSAIGAKVVRMSPDVHDQKLALTSHMPHVVSAALAALVEGDDQQWAGSGFRDTTRIGAGDPTLWTQIFSMNREHVVESIRAYERELACLRELIERDDTDQIHQYLTKAKKNRDALGS